ncbi:DUF4426 domain-containing protein [Marinomonas ostreistagni]|uniref:DUF4426 domain-containing protein n=1 Tax=Marinomonas ostreistagni TaxID=359209 RepID=UPI001950437D|nr:DUF4426 domain-containing protein [Marinomonas ostreistagni]MBM6550545.1 DUF4426 domain-containing protein [Marinomonas ostreistagni]
MKWLLSVLLTCVVSLAHAEQVQSFGRYQLHFNTFESAFLTPEIAQQYGLTRSKGQGLLNIAVTTQADGEVPQSQPAIVSGHIKNLMGQIIQLSFQTIDEGDAVYYLAPFRKTDDEILKFHIEAKTSADAEPMTVDFQRHFYVD